MRCHSSAAFLYRALCQLQLLHDLVLENPVCTAQHSHSSCLVLLALALVSPFRLMWEPWRHWEAAIKSFVLGTEAASVSAGSKSRRFIQLSVSVCQGPTSTIFYMELGFPVCVERIEIVQCPFKTARWLLHNNISQVLLSILCTSWFSCLLQKSTAAQLMMSDSKESLYSTVQLGMCNIYQADKL